jgi:hypothetical protein
MKSCRWCDKNFDSDISYQIYCSEQCREEATKEKIAQRYIQSRRQKRKGKIDCVNNVEKSYQYTMMMHFVVNVLLIPMMLKKH